MEVDEAMRRAMMLGERARLRTPPNPWVGCVILRDGAIVGEGATEAPGGRHAEVVALDAAGADARGATVVVTLEPCAHQGRTGPCVDALIGAGVARVVYGIEDPDPDVAGAGHRSLELAGIPVTKGIESDALHASLRTYLHHRTTGRPWVCWKTAMSLDGRIAARDGSSQWITSEESRRVGHGLRAASQAILIGSGTAVADRPALTVRDGSDGSATAPLRVLLDAHGTTPAQGPLFDPTLGPTLVFTADDVDGSDWREAGAEVMAVATDPSGISLDPVLRELGVRGVLQALVEGGARVAGSFLAADLVNEVVAFVAPQLLGSEALPAAHWSGPATLEDPSRWRCMDVQRIGPDVCLTYQRRN